MLSKMVSGAKKLFSLILSPLKPVKAVISGLWSKAEEKVPVLRFLRGFWLHFAMLIGAVTAVGVGLVISATFSGQIGIISALTIIALLPALLIYAMIVTPASTALLMAQAALITVIINLVFAATEPVEADNIVNLETGETVNETTGEILEVAPQGAPA